MTPVADFFDFNKNLEAFQKFYPNMPAMNGASPFGAMPSFDAAPFKAATDIMAKYREVAVEALNKNVELTTAWMKDAAKDATTLLTTEAQPQAYAKKAGEVAQASFQDLPSRLFAYAEVAKKAQAELMDTVIAVSPKLVEEAAERTKTATRTASDAVKAVSKKAAA
jgi:hypothetical protein